MIWTSEESSEHKQVKLRGRINEPVWTLSKVSFNIVYSDEAIQEIKNYLNSKIAYTDTGGGLKYGVNNPITSLVLFNFTRGLVNG